jgi:hypothetical protein
VHNDPPASESRSRWVDRPALLTVTALVALGAGTGLALAATSGSAAPRAAGSLSAATSPAATSPPGTFRPGQAGAPGPGPGCARIVAPTRVGLLCRRTGMLGGVLHGSFVVPKAAGGTVTVDIQNGKVTSVSQSSITLKSSDGFTKTYAVTGSTTVDAQRNGIGSVKVGDQVWVTATPSGGTVTATRVMDLTQIQADRGHWFGSLPAPTSGSAATSSFGSSAAG